MHRRDLRLPLNHLNQVNTEGSSGMTEERHQRWTAPRLAQGKDGARFGRQVQLRGCLTDGWSDRLTAHKQKEISHGRVSWQAR
jgi:hypothetical protein